MRFAFAVAACLLVACHKDATPPPTTQPTNAEATAPAVDPAVQADRDQFLSDASTFLHISKDEVLDRTTVHNTGMKDEWKEWEAKGPMTDDRIKQFYKETKNYIFDLGGWHLWDPRKHTSDVAFVEELKQDHVKNVLDFGGGVGFNSLLFAKAGIDTTLADLDSVTLQFAMFRAEQQHVKLKFWKSDVEPMPPDAKYDAIVCLDVLEHLPQAELKTAVDKLVKLKHANTKIIIHAPFGRTAQHPMHLDASEETNRQVVRLQTELPKD